MRVACGDCIGQERVPRRHGGVVGLIVG